MYDRSSFILIPIQWACPWRFAFPAGELSEKEERWRRRRRRRHLWSRFLLHPEPADILWPSSLLVVLPSPSSPGRTARRGFGLRQLGSHWEECAAGRWLLPPATPCRRKPWWRDLRRLSPPQPTMPLPPSSPFFCSSPSSGSPFSPWGSCTLLWPTSCRKGRGRSSKKRRLKGRRRAGRRSRRRPGPAREALGRRLREKMMTDD